MHVISAMSRYTPADLSLQSDAILQNTTEENVKYLLNAGSMADSPLPEAEKDLFLGFTAETQSAQVLKARSQRASNYAVVIKDCGSEAELSFPIRNEAKPDRKRKN